MIVIYYCSRPGTFIGGIEGLGVERTCEGFGAHV